MGKREGRNEHVGEGKWIGNVDPRCSDFNPFSSEEEEARQKRCGRERLSITSSPKDGPLQSEPCTAKLVRERKEKARGEGKTARKRGRWTDRDKIGV